MLGEYRKRRQIEGQGAVIAVLEVEADLRRRFDLHALDRFKLGSVLQVALRHQQLVGVLHITGGNRRAVRETCLGVQVKAQGEAIRATLHFLGDKPVDGVGLIHRARGQWRVEHAIDLRNAHAFVGERHQVIELADFDGRAPHAATFGRVRVHVIEVLEVDGIAWRFAVNGQSVLRGCGQRLGSANEGQRQGEQR